MAQTLNITINIPPDVPLNVTEAVIYNAVPGVQGNWGFVVDGDAIIYSLNMSDIGSSGGLRFFNPLDGTNVLLAFGYWIADNNRWFGISNDLGPVGVASDALAAFYGDGQFNHQGIEWAEGGVFARELANERIIQIALVGGGDNVWDVNVTLL